MKAFAILPLFALFLGSITASGYQKAERFSQKTSGAVSLNATDAKDLAPSRLELSLKKGLISKYLKDTKNFALEMDDYQNSPLYQSFIDEVHECMGISGSTLPNDPSKRTAWLEKCPVSIAREVAKKQFLLSIKRNWKDIKNTIFNDFGDDNWERARVFIIRKLQESLLFAPKSPNKGGYVFVLNNAGFAQVDRKTLRNGYVVLQIGDLDENRLEPGAENIRSDLDQKSNEELPSFSNEEDNSF